MQFAVDSGVLRFGQFKTKAGRLSPYFFNAGLFDDGAKLGRLAQFYAQRILASGIEFDMIFGPAYKGIPLAAAVAIELARLGRNVPYAYNRKEAKDHGEGGTLVGAPVQGPGADRRRRDVGRHGGARVDRHHPGRRRHAACGGDRAGPAGKGHRERAWTWTTAPCSMYATSWACRFARLRGWPICSSIWNSTAATSWARTMRQVLAYRQRYGVE